MKSIFGIILCIGLTFAGPVLSQDTPNTETDLQAQTDGTSGYSADPGAYDLLTPIGNIAKVEDQTQNGFSDYVNLIIRIAIALAGAIAVIIIIVSGIQYMGTESVWGKSESKIKIGSAIGGIVLLLTSYIILYTINPDLVTIRLGISKGTEGEWDRPAVPKKDGTYEAPPTGSSYKSCSALVDGNPIKVGNAWPQDKQSALVDELRVAGIDVASSSGKLCSRVGETGCTSMYFNPETEKLVKTRLTELQKKVGANITVTGGSECWLHKTHGPDDARIDLRVSENLNRYVNSFAPTVTDKSSFPGNNLRITVPGIGSFLSEGEGGTAKTTGAHWHVDLK